MYKTSEYKITYRAFRINVIDICGHTSCAADIIDVRRGSTLRSKEIRPRQVQQILSAVQNLWEKHWSGWIKGEWRDG